MFLELERLLTDTLTTPKELNYLHGESNNISILFNIFKDLKNAKFVRFHSEVIHNMSIFVGIYEGEVPDGVYITDILYNGNPCILVAIPTENINPLDGNTYVNNAISIISTLLCIIINIFITDKTTDAYNNNIKKVAWISIPFIIIKIMRKMYSDSVVTKIVTEILPEHSDLYKYVDKYFVDSVLNVIEFESETLDRMLDDSFILLINTDKEEYKNLWTPLEKFMDSVKE